MKTQTTLSPAQETKLRSLLHRLAIVRFDMTEWRSKKFLPRDLTFLFDMLRTRKTQGDISNKEWNTVQYVLKQLQALQSWVKGESAGPVYVDDKEFWQ